MRRVLLVVLTLILGLNLYFHFFISDPITRAKIRTLSLSRGDRYYYTLHLWYLLTDIGDWDSASKLEIFLDPADTAYNLAQNSPSALKKRLNNLTAKSDKSVEDWIELAQVQIRLGKTVPAINSLTQAQTLDPIRDDISKMLSELRR